MFLKHELINQIFFPFHQPTMIEMNTMEEEMLLCSFIQMLIKSFVIKPCGTPFVYLQVSKGPTGN